MSVQEAAPVEIYTPDRKAEFLLNNAVDAEDYRCAVREVRSLGIDPEAVPHANLLTRSAQTNEPG